MSTYWPLWLMFGLFGFGVGLISNWAQIQDLRKRIVALEQAAPDQPLGVQR